jgi:hypothetical protein
VRPCPYCLRLHGRPAPAVYCSPDCSKRAARQNARAAGQLRRVWLRRRRHARQVALDAEKWRGAAIGRKSLEQLIADVFGVSEVPPMRDTAE